MPTVRACVCADPKHVGVLLSVGQPLTSRVRRSGQREQAQGRSRNRVGLGFGFAELHNSVHVRWEYKTYLTRRF